MKPILALDVDDVQRAFTQKAFEIYRRDFDPEFNETLDVVKVFDLMPYFKKLPYSVFDFINNYAEELFVHTPPFEENIADVVSQLQEKYIIHMTTHQFKGNEAYTFQWFERLGIPYDDVSFVRDKSVVDAHILVDDGAHNLDSFLAVGKEVACINRPWNESWRSKNSDQPSYDLLSAFLKNYDHEALRDRSIYLFKSKSKGVVDSLPSVSSKNISEGFSRDDSKKNYGGLKPTPSSTPHLGPKRTYNPDSAKRKLKK